MSFSYTCTRWRPGNATTTDIANAIDASSAEIAARVLSSVNNTGVVAPTLYINKTKATTVNVGSPIPWDPAGANADDSRTGGLTFSPDGTKIVVSAAGAGVYHFFPVSFAGNAAMPFGIYVDNVLIAPPAARGEVHWAQARVVNGSIIEVRCLKAGQELKGMAEDACFSMVRVSA